MKNNISFFDGKVKFLGLFEKYVGKDTSIFEIQLRKENGDAMRVNTEDAGKIEMSDSSCIYDGFNIDICVSVSVLPSENGNLWGISIKNNTDLAIEWVEYPRIPLKPLKKNGGNAQILLPFNEGVLVDDAKKHIEGEGVFPKTEIEYPSCGNYFMFPHMMSSQFMGYMDEEGGLYIGAHDEKRGPKALDFLLRDDMSVVLAPKIFTGCDFGDSYKLDFPIVTEFFKGDWQDAAEIYRSWFENSLSSEVKKIKDNYNLPSWYEEAPVVITYPVRGVHDMDKMDANSLFPYINALPIIDEIAEKLNHKIMILLMHWEGTAPWAPPYVWPPYGGEEAFNKFLDALHQRGDLLGVYCSGFGFTLQSNLIAEYNNSITLDEAKKAMCTAPNGEVMISRICTAQRSGYDVCPVSTDGKAILERAYTPLFNSGVDYAQILDQNHGGAQYFCYSREHGHPYIPGPWMTENMKKMLSNWNSLAPNMLMGCESAAAEPFISNLLLSDNRYEINYYLGKAVPLYSYLYHEYLRNFMGNQVSCPFDIHQDTLPLRLAYSFVAGDYLTFTMLPNGEFMSHWGCRDFSTLPNKEKALLFASRLLKFYKTKAKKFLHYGRMEKPLRVECENNIIKLAWNENIEMPMVFSTAWSYEGEKAQIFVNYNDFPVQFKCNGKTFVMEAFSAEIMEIVQK